MVKTRDPDLNVDIDDLNMRVRLSDEIDLNKSLRNGSIPELYSNSDIDALIKSKHLKLSEVKRIKSNISFRLKERTSLLFEEGTGYVSKIDLTSSKTLKNIHKLSDTHYGYELEIEHMTKSKPQSQHLDKMFSMAEICLKVIQQNAYIMTNSLNDRVVEFYKESAGIREDIRGLVGRQPISLEIQHVIDKVPNKYAITDKADGDRYFMVVMNREVYLISSNLNVRYTGITVKDDKYNGTICDGEFIYLSEHRRHMYMIFDCLKIGGTDYRKEVNIFNRLAKADEMIEECFVFKGQKGFTFKEPSGEFDVEKYAKFYGEELKRFYAVLNNDIEVRKDVPLIRRKFFMSVTGGASWEVFRYMSEFWERYSRDDTVVYPIELDGLILHPIEQAYVTKGSTYSEYKWKPPEMNSIDFYIEFERDPTTKQILDVYDNTEDIKNKPYRICRLYVGESIKGKERPIPFSKISNAYIYLTDGELKDIHGDIISDKTVVEFYYVNDPEITPSRRWVPMRTRYDKTESVEKHKRKYGNYVTVANKVWRSIINPFTVEDFNILGRGNTKTEAFYSNKMAEIRKRIGDDLITEINKEEGYHKGNSKLAKSMRWYHNIVKSALIYLYCSPQYNRNNKVSVLDMACGRGGDIQKYYFTKIKNYVGVDIDYSSLHSPNNGAISRYNNDRAKRPDFPSMTFIQADAGAILDVASQKKALFGMGPDNVKLLEKYFGNEKIKYDRVSCQFAIHYFFKSNTTWNNFKTNLKNHIKDGGYFFFTTFDAHKLIEAIGQNTSYNTTYNNNGTEELFFDIQKDYDNDTLYNDDGHIGVGHQIRVHAAWLFAKGKYEPEYLVDKNFITKELENDCDMELVDTDLFQNMIAMQERYFNGFNEYESTVNTFNTISNVATYYDGSEINDNCRKYTNLTRYYVFRKKGSDMTGGCPCMAKMVDGMTGGSIEDIGQVEHIGGCDCMKGGCPCMANVNMSTNMKGGSTNSIIDFYDTDMYTIVDLHNYDDELSLISSLHKILVTHGYIPKNIGVGEFMESQEMNLTVDEELDSIVYDGLTNINVQHEIDDEIVDALNGLNIFVVEKDCNDFYDVYYYPHKSKKCVVIVKDEGSYHPLLRHDPEGMRGIFTKSDPLVEYLVNIA
jgi:hypothetical protein